MDCYYECPYYSNRLKASESPTSVLNYNYWLTMMNEVNPFVEDDMQSFPPRDFLIADESHKINDIIQNAVAPVIYKDDILKFKKLTEFFNDNNLGNLFSTFKQIEIFYDNIFEYTSESSSFNLLISFVKQLENYKESILVLSKELKRYKNQKIPKSWKSALTISNWLNKLKIKLKEYLYAINKTNVRNLIKNQNEDKITFNCLDEKYLMNNFFHKHTGFLILMSATISDPVAYLTGLNIKNAKYIKLKSQFDFSKSPIYFYNGRKINYKDTEKHLPWLVNKVKEIIDNHKNDSGLIHSGSYSLALKIYEKLSAKYRNRILLYSGTTEKREGLEEFKKSKDKIILGPSLLEGLDLKNDLGRFQIFLKIPYLSLGDIYVKAKMTINPKWYQWNAIVSLLQGTGRIVRNENDWGITYILDGSFANLLHYNRSYFPIEFTQRLKLIKDI